MNSWNKKKIPTDLILIIALLIVQIIFWNGIRFEVEDSPKVDDKGRRLKPEYNVLWQGTRFIKPDLGVVPDVPKDSTVKALSFGDEQFYFRAAAFQIQNAGDTFGRSTSLKDYDYSKLYKWWMILDGLDSKSDFTPSMVSYYYGASRKHKEHMPFVVDYLEQHADKDPAKKWWWYSQAIYHVKHKLKDKERALKIAKKMAAIPENAQMAIWGWQMEAFILEDMGEYKEACKIILNLLDTHENLKEGEINFMMHFVNERISAMVAADNNSNNIDIDPRCRMLVDIKKKENQEGKQQNDNTQ